MLYLGAHSLVGKTKDMTNYENTHGRFEILEEGDIIFPHLLSQLHLFGDFITCNQEPWLVV